MKCTHNWRPLVNARTIAGVFVASMQGLTGYDRCTLCGRVGWTTQSRFARRKFTRPEHQEKLLARAAEFEAWEAAHPDPPVLPELRNPSHNPC